MISFGIKIILLLLIIGGAIAFIGDYIGKSIGKNRLTVFNLRPRHSAILITVITGILIALITLLAMLAVSKDARTALFGLQKLKQELNEKGNLLNITKIELKTAEEELASAQADQQKAKTEIQGLEKTKQKLKKQVEIARQGNVLFRKGDTLLTSIIQGGPEKEKLKTGLEQILSAAEVYVKGFGIDTAQKLIYLSPQDFESTLTGLQLREGENIVIVAATQNTLFGEEVPVRLEIRENKLIYKAGEAITEGEISPVLSVPEIEQEIKKILALTHQSALRAGIVPDPSGSIGSVPYSEIFALARKINQNKKGVLLKTIAETETYAIGPLKIIFKIYYK